LYLSKLLAQFLHLGRHLGVATGGCPERMLDLVVEVAGHQMEQLVAVDVCRPEDLPAYQSPLVSPR
jgi:hypothetical protein